ncbi:MAG TPA: IPExxxVDY family protein [Sphingobacteriaceae bacterium]|nr:IPExxxVDY family protein [Sphingobacteriaceae bacterium]
MSKLTLKYEPDLDFILVAITAPLKDYRFCFKLNKQLNIQFDRIEELSLQFYSGEYQVQFTRYHYYQAQSETDFYLIANKGTEGFLIPEMNNVDFFILIRNYIDNESLEQFITGINKIPEVQVAVEVDPKKLKSKENLIF